LQETAFFFSSNGILPDEYVTVVAMEGEEGEENAVLVYMYL
jgi:hypothetical protein